MKRLLIFFILFIIPTNAYAEEVYYSSYSDFTPWQEDFIEGSDLINVEREDRYKWYKEEIINDNYYFEGLNNSLYPYKNEADYIETEFSDWSTIEPDQIINRTIETQNIYSYRYMQGVRYIHIKNVLGGFDAFRITEIKIYYDNSPINFSISCSSCSSGFQTYVKNNNIYENMSYVNNGGSLTIDLGSLYSLSSLKIELYLYDRGYDYKRFTISITKDNYTNSNIFAEKEVAEAFRSDELIPNQYTYVVDSSWLKKPLWNVLKETTNPIIPDLCTQVNNYSKYRYKDKLFMYYDKVKKYYDDNYYRDSPDLEYQKDESDLKEYYRSQIREKVTINDNIEINEKEYNVLDYIDSTFNKEDIAISSNIDINKNGTYYVNYILPFDNLIINKEVVVDIKENDEKTNTEENNDNTNNDEIIKAPLVNNQKVETVTIEKRDDQKKTIITEEKIDKSIREKNKNNNKKNLINNSDKNISLYICMYIILSLIVLIIIFNKFFIKY